MEYEFSFVYVTEQVCHGNERSHRQKRYECNHVVFHLGEKSMIFVSSSACLVCKMLCLLQAQSPFETTWDSIDKRPIPEWFEEAKFGIFIHWGVYSVPAWGPKGKYAEWYWHDMQNHEGETWQFHCKHYGETFAYQDFAPLFKAEMFDPEHWADIFVRSGAKYVVLTSKHHEGFCLWPSAESWNWNSVDVGPHRDLCGDLSQAVKARGLKMGFYYSLYEWFNPTYRTHVERYVSERMLPQLKDLVVRYEPDLVWTDGEWGHTSDVWRATEFLAWLFNESPVREKVVVNDRWGKECRGVHGGFYTTEYGHGNVQKDSDHPWEECRGIGASFGYNRNETVDDYATGKQLVRLLVDTASRGGNLLLDIGPTADGRIPEIMEQRLLEIGEWLRINGESIYGTKKGPELGLPWAKTTTKAHRLYVHLVDKPTGRLVLPSDIGVISSVYTLGSNPRDNLHYEKTPEGFVVALPQWRDDESVMVLCVELQ